MKSPSILTLVHRTIIQLTHINPDGGTDSYTKRRDLLEPAAAMLLSIPEGKERKNPSFRKNAEALFVQALRCRNQTDVGRKLLPVLDPDFVDKHVAGNDTVWNNEKYKYLSPAALDAYYRQQAKTTLKFRLLWEPFMKWFHSLSLDDQTRILSTRFDLPEAKDSDWQTVVEEIIGHPTTSTLNQLAAERVNEKKGWREIFLEALKSPNDPKQKALDSVAQFIDRDSWILEELSAAEPDEKVIAAIQEYFGGGNPPAVAVRVLMAAALKEKNTSKFALLQKFLAAA